MYAHVCVCVCAHVAVDVHMCVHLGVCAHVHVYLHMWVCACMCICLHEHVCACSRVCVCMWCVCACVLGPWAPIPCLRHRGRNNTTGSENNEVEDAADDNDASSEAKDGERSTAAPVPSRACGRPSRAPEQQLPCPPFGPGTSAECPTMGTRGLPGPGLTHELLGLARGFGSPLPALTLSVPFPFILPEIKASLGNERRQGVGK